MAINFDGVVIDQIKEGIAEDFSGNLKYRLTQLQDATISTSSENKEAKDKNGVLIKRTYTSKSVEFKATNALIDFNIWGATTGSGKTVADSSNPIQMPKILILDPSTEPITLQETPVDGTVRVSAITGNGTMGKAYTKSTSASATSFAVSTNKLTLPTDSTASQYLVKYEYSSSNGIMIENVADKFPATVKLTLTVLAFESCSVDTLRKAYIVFPSFQVSPDSEISLSTDSTMDYSGSAQVAYCGKKRTLYVLYFAEDDIEE